MEKSQLNLTEEEKLKQELLLTEEWVRKASHDFKSGLSNLLWVLDSVQKGDLSFDQFLVLLPTLRTEAEQNIQLLEVWAAWKKLQIRQGDPLDRVVGAELYASLQQNYSEKIKEKQLEFELREGQSEILNLNLPILLFLLGKVLDNAIKFSHPGKKIKFHIKIADGAYLFEIEDEGVGMSESTLENLFSLHATVFTGTGGELGLGFSLILVKYFLYLLQGKLEIRSLYGEGTRVSISVPNND